MIRQSAPTQTPPKPPKPEPINRVLLISTQAARIESVNQIQSDLLKVTHQPAAAAIELCQSEQFDLALIDVQANEQGSIEAMDLARSLYQQCELRTLLLAYDDQFELLQNANDAGAIGLLAGHCSSEYLLLAIRIGIARALELRALATREAQLVTALNAEREINTAIGILMERMQLPRTDAFETLRRYARSQRQQMAQIATKMLQSVNETNELLMAIGTMSVGRSSPKQI